MAKYKLPIKVVLIKNNSLGQIKWEQIALEGNPEFGIDLYPIDFAMYAQACGIPGFTLEDPSQAESTLRQAMQQPGPALVQAVVDQNEPIMPGIVSMEEATRFLRSMLKGDKDRWDILKTVAEDRVRENI